MADKPRTLFYDIETTPLMAYVWQLGKQVVRHGQLVEGYQMWDIICIGYCWNDGKPAKVIDWGYRNQNSEPMIEKFTKVIESADVVIGKNNKRFDDKMINLHRWRNNLHGMPDWLYKSDDLETHLRRNLRLPSYGLDYVSSILGLGGKVKMELSDWVDIMHKRDYSKFKKMKYYCGKDVEDTRTIWDYSVKHFEPKYNCATMELDELVCKVCGSPNIRKNGRQYPKGTAIYQSYWCKDHRGYAGKKTIGKSGKLGRTI